MYGRRGDDESLVVSGKLVRVTEDFRSVSLCNQFLFLSSQARPVISLSVWIAKLVAGSTGIS